jgi:protocatechuate 3,4-dioxygenase beta subunit
VREVLLGLIPAGTIAGHVFDRDGEPLAGVNVQAFKYVYQNGDRVLSSVQQARTNDLGEYRLYWLNPGQYYISATHTAGPGGIINAVAEAAGGALAITPPAGAPGPVDIGQIRAAIDSVAGQLGQLGGGRVAALLAEPQATGDQTYIPVYYPGTTDVETASAIDLRPGTIFNGIDLTVAQAPTLKVRGQIIGANGQPAQNAQVMLVPKRRIGIAMGNQFRGRGLNEAGTFEIRGVVPGSYDLIAMMNDRGNPTSARVSLDIGGADIENVTLVLTPGVTITGRLLLEGMPANTNPQRLRVTLNSLTPMAGGFLGGARGGGGQRGNPPGLVSADGAFTLQNVAPGDYRVIVQGLPRNAYIKMARFGAADALQQGLVVDGSRSGALDVLVSGNTGSIEGVVQDERQNPSANSQVVLVPDPTKRHRPDLYRSINTDASGKFRLDGIPPGDYKVFAWEDVETGAWQDPDFLNRYEEAGRVVRMAENGQATAELRVIPAGQ